MGIPWLSATTCVTSCTMVLMRFPDAHDADGETPPNGSAVHRSL
jgi:hypothetical protein